MLIKLSNGVDNGFVKKTVYDKLAIKDSVIVNKIPSTSGLVIKRQNDLDKQGLEKLIEDFGKKISNTSGLVKKTNYNKKITEIENDISRVARLVTTTALNAKATEIENEIPDITNLAATDALNTKSADVEIKYLRLLICLSRLI